MSTSTNGAAGASGTGPSAGQLNTPQYSRKANRFVPIISEQLMEARFTGGTDPFLFIQTERPLPISPVASYKIPDGVPTSGASPTRRRNLNRRSPQPSPPPHQLAARHRGAGFLMAGILKFDGASKGNPGKAGAGAVLMDQDGRVVSRISEGLGFATNNEAEYRALILGLKRADELGFKSIEVHGDSQLVCKQVNGEWQTRNQNMRELCNEVQQLKQNFDSFEMKHVPRGSNAEADRQANIGATLPRGAVSEERGDYY